MVAIAGQRSSEGRCDQGSFTQETDEALGDVHTLVTLTHCGELRVERALPVDVERRTLVEARRIADR